jgi:hypothetical protein
MMARVRWFLFLLVVEPDGWLVLAQLAATVAIQARMVSAPVWFGILMGTSAAVHAVHVWHDSGYPPLREE